MASSFLVFAQMSYWYSFRCVSFVAEVADDLVLLLLAQLELALFLSVKTAHNASNCCRYC